MDEDATWYGVGLGPGHIVLHGAPASSLKRGTAAPNFRPMTVVAKTAGLIKMPLGMDVGLGRSHVVLDGAHTPGAAPDFWPMYVVAKGLYGS